MGRKKRHPEDKYSRVVRFKYVPPYPKKHTMALVFTPEEYLALWRAAGRPDNMRGWAKSFLLSSGLEDPEDAAESIAEMFRQRGREMREAIDRHFEEKLFGKRGDDGD